MSPYLLKQHDLWYPKLVPTVLHIPVFDWYHLLLFNLTGVSIMRGIHSVISHRVRVFEDVSVFNIVQVFKNLCTYCRYNHPSINKAEWY
jgi:hypothetical protein